MLVLGHSIGAFPWVSALWGIKIFQGLVVLCEFTAKKPICTIFCSSSTLESGLKELYHHFPRL